MSETRLEETSRKINKKELSNDIKSPEKTKKGSKRVTRRMSRLSIETFVPQSHSRIKSGPLPKDVPTLTTK